MLAGFLAPFVPQAGTGWSTLDGFVSTAAVAGTIVAAAAVFELPAVAFGLFWFLSMALAVPAEPLAALPGLSVAAVSALVLLLTPFLEARSSWFKADWLEADR
jgi:hypothetical protein